MLYTAAVVSNRNNKLYEITSLLSQKKSQGHLDTAATGKFLQESYSHLGTKLPHEQSEVLYANNTTMSSTTTRQLNLSPALPATAQQGRAFNEMDKSPLSVLVLCDVGCKVIFGEHDVQVTKIKKGNNRR